MNNQQDNQEMNDDIANAEARIVSVGRTLREAREQLGLSVNDVANRIKFAPKQIEWLEADDFERLPEAAFVRGFVRSYARLVELEPAVLLSSLPSSHVQTKAPPVIKSMEVAMPTAFSARRHNIVWLAAALVIALSLAIFERMQDRAPEKAGNAVKTVIQPLDLPGTKGESEVVAPSGEQEPKSEVVAAIEQKPQQAPVTAVLPAETRQPVKTPAAPVVATQPNIVKQSVLIEPAPTPVKAPVNVPAPVKAPAPAKEPPAKVVPAPVPVQVPQQEQQEAVSPKPESSFSFGNLFKRNTTPPAAPEPSQPEATTKPVPEKPVKANAEANGVEHSLRLEFDEDAWVEIKDENGNVLISKMHKAGSLVRVAGKSALDVTIGNAKAVRLFDKGKKINLERYTTAEVARIKLK